MIPEPKEHRLRTPTGRVAISFVTLPHRVSEESIALELGIALYNCNDELSGHWLSARSYVDEKDFDAIIAMWEIVNDVG